MDENLKRIVPNSIKTLSFSESELIKRVINCFQLRFEWFSENSVITSV